MIEKISKGKAKLTVNIGSGEHRRRRTKTVTYSTQKELKELYRKFEDEVLHNPYTDTMLDELCEAYLRNVRVRNLSENTIIGYKNAHARIPYEILRMKARDVSTYVLDDFVVAMTGKYSSKTIKNTISFIKAAYSWAIKTGMLEKNPCLNVTMPKKEQKEISTLAPEQMHKLLHLLSKERLDFRVGYELALMCGLRRGEILGLKEEDINIPFRSVSVNKTRYYLQGKEYVQETKTVRSHRTLALPETLTKDIAALIELHHSQRFNKCDYLIQDGFGQPLNPSTFSNRIIQIEKASGMDHVSAHGLRHTFATMLNAAHVDLAQISAELGHSNLSTTLNVYTHVFGNLTTSSRNIADTIDKAFSEPATFLPLSEDDEPLKLSVSNG